MTPFLSVIIPTSNAGEKLARSLQSVTALQKPFDSLEVLVMDAVSTDETAVIGREWAARDERIQFWSAPDKGIYDGMNKGIEKSSGRFLYFLGAGDLVRAGTFEALSKLPNLHPLLLLHGQVWYPGSNVEPGAGAGLGVLDLARYNIPHQGAFYGRQIFEKVGLYEPKYTVCADYEFNWRCWTNPHIETRFWNHIVADFELGGVSGSGQDAAFKRDWPRHLRARGGLMAWLVFRVSQRVSARQMQVLRRLRRVFPR